MEEKHFKKPNFFKSKVRDLVVVSTGREKGEYFEGIILNADKSETNGKLDRSNNYRKTSFDLLDIDDVVVTIK
jgi:hypothetical protein